MDPTDERIADDLIGRQIDIFRFTAHERAVVLQILKTLEEDLIELLFHSGKKLTDIGRADKAAILRQAQEVIAQSYGETADAVAADLAGLGQFEAKATAASLGAAFASAIKPALPTEGFFKSLVSNTLIDGAPSAAWWKRQQGDVAFRFASAMRQGLAAAETNDQIIRRVTGTKADPGVMGIARNNAAALVQTSVQTLSNAARFETFNANEDILKGYRQLSTLDGHTTVICVAYAGKQWDLKREPIGHDLPFVSPKGAVSGTPRHWNCRSLISVITKSFKELGLDIPEWKPKTRSASGGPVAAGTTFEQYIARQPAGFAAELLGEGRAELYRDRKITLSQLLDQTGRPLTLAELRAKYE